MDQERIIGILQLIAQGRSYEQIIAACPDLTYTDIFAAAAEAIRMVSESPNDHNARLDDIKREYPMAYEPWTSSEEDILRELRRDGLSTTQIARELERQPSAISSRLRKLGLD